MALFHTQVGACEIAERQMRAYAIHRRGDLLEEDMSSCLDREKHRNSLGPGLATKGLRHERVASVPKRLELLTEELVEAKRGYSERAQVLQEPPVVAEILVPMKLGE